MLIVAITGNAGSGKSTLAGVFAALHIDIINADNINSELLSCSQFMLKWLEKCLGIVLILDDGRIDKAALRSSLIEQENYRRSIESLLHPVIRENIELQCSLLGIRPYCVVEIPLLFEVGMEDFADRIILVATTRKTLLSRIEYRHGINTETAKNILDMQQSGTHIFSKSDDIILNDKDKEMIEAAVLSLHNNLTQLSCK